VLGFVGIVSGVDIRAIQIACRNRFRMSMVGERRAAGFFCSWVMDYVLYECVAKHGRQE
jgi:hypothetical protein